MYTAKVGRDHLGLGSVSSDQILPSLSPGINVLTHHPRYHSFYIFLLDEFWGRERPRNEAAWKKFYRPREFIFSVGANLCEQPEHGEMGKIVGAQKTASLAAQEQSHYDTSFPYIESPLGGYGLYYRSVMAEMELIYPGGPGFPYPIDVPTELGKQVAAAFRRAIQNTTYYRDYFDQDQTQVPIAAIREYIHRACLCQLQKSGAPDRPLLLDVFLRHGPNVEARRATFRLLLDIANQTQGYSLDQNAFRLLLYSQATAEGAAYQPQEAVLDTYRRWRLYQAREYYAFALNALWGYLCDWGLSQNGDLRSIPLPQFWQHLETALDFKALARWLEIPQPRLSSASSFQELLEWLQRLVGAHGTTFDAACTLDGLIHESSLLWLPWQEPQNPVIVAGMVAMLALIYLRFRQPELRRQPEWAISRMGADGRLSLNGFLRTLDRQIKAGGVTIGEVARWLYADYIILQHQLIANGKLPDNTFRFRREGNRLLFYKLQNSLDFMDSRFDALSTTIHELGLCGDLRQPHHPLTPDGERLLATGDLA
ncbi:MAG: hypothetical protein BroJett011_18250 [Chloroflexota bacterium]|nr:MAG: hypothetical protein BroJett011_18250 [Chloroflexota bacterium]